MNTKLVNAVIMAEDYPEMVKWYKTVLELETIHEDSAEYHYTELGQNGKNLVGIAKADEMDHVPTSCRNNSCLLQIHVDDIDHFFKNVKASKSVIRFGPSREEGSKFSYGSVSDPEGNEIWVISYDKN